MHGIPQIENTTLVKPGPDIEKPQRVAGYVLPRDEKPRLYSVGDVGHAVRIQIVSKLKHVPDVPAHHMRGVRGANRPPKSWLVIKAVPEAVSQKEVPDAALIRFPAHRVNSALL